MEPKAVNSKDQKQQIRNIFQFLTVNILFLQHLWFQHAGTNPQLGKTLVVYCPQRNNSHISWEPGRIWQDTLEEERESNSIKSTYWTLNLDSLILASYNSIRDFFHYQSSQLLFSLEGPSPVRVCAGSSAQLGRHAPSARGLALPQRSRN